MRITRALGAAPGPSVRGFRLLVLRGPSAGRAHELAGAITRVGKDRENDVVVADPTVSRAHFEIVRAGEGFLLRDLDSTNGTFVEEARVREAFLAPGARIRAGAALFRFVPVEEAAEPAGRERFGELVTASPRMAAVLSLLERAARTPSTVLLLGETGTGKGAAARAIHRGSDRREGPLVVVDCGAISRTLIESELFGHERGAFTGAVATRRGALESCAGGTLFLDEVDDLPLELQPKLLRALEDRVVQRLGGRGAVPLDVRVVAATKRELREEVAAGRFREDLYFRLSVVVVPLPPLRERPEDLPVLFDRFHGRPGAFDALEPEARGRLRAHRWPGNVRELRNAVERAACTGDLSFAEAGSFGADDGRPRLLVDPLRPFKDAKEELVHRFEREYLVHLFARCEGNVARAAREAGIDRKYLYVLARKHGLSTDGAAGEGEP